MFKFIKENIEDIRQHLRESKPDYQQELKWSKPNEKILLAWEIKAIAQYWMDLLGIPAITVIIVSLCGGLYAYFAPEEYPWLVIFAMGAPVASGAFLLDWCVKTHFVYRLTESGIEFHSWRVYPDFLFSGIKLLFIILGILVLVIGFIGQQGFLVLAGPVAIAIVVALPATDSSYKKAMINARYRGADWKNIERIQYDSKKKLLRLDYDFKRTEEEKQKALIESQIELEGTGYNVVDVITYGVTIP